MNPMDTSSKQSQSGQSQSGQSGRTGVSDEAYDLMTTLSNKLQELWRVEKFAQDQQRGSRHVWESIRQHDQQDVQALLQELKKTLQ
jgi:hypothetical protein